LRAWWSAPRPVGVAGLFAPDSGQST